MLLLVAVTRPQQITHVLGSPSAPARCSGAARYSSRECRLASAYASILTYLNCTATNLQTRPWRACNTLLMLGCEAAIGDAFTVTYVQIHLDVGTLAVARVSGVASLRTEGVTMFLDYFALVMLIIGISLVIYTFIYIHDIPYQIAKKRDHSQKEAIHLACWLSLFTLHAIWPIVFIWAVMKPKPLAVKIEEDDRGLINQRLHALEAQIAEIKTSLTPRKEST
jgi:hypothetical protein